MAGKTWIQSTPPPAGVTYEWAGDWNASESIKRVDGVWTARNWIIEPVVSVAWPSNWGRASTVSWEPVPGGRRVWAHSDTPRSNQMISWSSAAELITLRGNTARMFATVTVPESAPRPVVLRLAVNLVYADGTPTSWTRGPEEVIVPGETRQLAHSVVSTTNVSHIALGIIAGIERTFDAGDEFILHDGISLFAGAAPSGLVEFSGDTPDDRADDTWINPDEYKEYVWDSATKNWIPNPSVAGLPLIHGDVMDQSWRETRDLTPSSDTIMASQWTNTDGISVRAVNQSVSFYGGGVPAIRFLVPSSSSVRPDRTRTPALARLAPRAEWNHPSRASYIRVSPGLRYEISGRAFYSGAYTPVGLGVSHRLVIQFFDESGAYIAARAVTQSPASTTQTQLAPTLYMTHRVPERAAIAEVLWTIAFSTENPDVELSNFALYLVDPKIELFGDASGVTEVGIATSAREGLVSDIFVRSREKIEVQLAQPDEQLIAGERIELAAFAATSTEVSWMWRQVTGPTVEIERRDNAAHFIAPDVDRPTDLRIACRAASTDGANRSNWHFFDLTIQPPRTRWIPDEGASFTPRSPQMVGYDRGKREIWNDVTPPVGMDPNGRWESVLRDLGIPADDVQFVTNGEPPARAAAGGVYIDMETRDIYRNFGGGYNESNDTEGAPRRNAYMVNPATGDIFEWREGES